MSSTWFKLVMIENNLSIISLPLLCLYTRVMRTFRFGPISFLHVAFCPHSPLTSVIRCFFFISFLFRAPHIFFFYFRLLFRYIPLWFLTGAPEFPIRGFNPGADRQSTMQSTVLSSKVLSTTVVYLRALLPVSFIPAPVLQVPAMLPCICNTSLKSRTPRAS